MDSERSRRFSSLRASLGTFSNFSQNDDADDVDDPISAYFKKRCGNNKSFCKKPESDSGSSLGLIDVDNMSLFDVEEENEQRSFRFSGCTDQLVTSLTSIEKIQRMSGERLSSTIPAPESELYKQRLLAQKALKRLSNRNSEKLNQESSFLPERKDGKALSDISSSLMNIKLSDTDEGKKKWFEPNFSPNTPRHFNDELSSLGGESETFYFKHNKKDFGKKESTTERETLYVKNINSIFKEVCQSTEGSELEFKTQTKQEQINQLEEDEKKFKLETGGILHNSRISEFSGVTGNDTQWPTENLTSKLENGFKNLSIGQFFNLRSSRVSSLIGTIAKENSLPNLVKELEASPPNAIRTQLISKSECSFPITHTPVPERPKFRRCVSTCDLKVVPEIAKTLRYSSDSCSSNSTAMVRDILAEMESGLSGTQMYEKLMKSYKRRESEGDESKKHEKQKKASGSSETPKSSKVPKEKNVTKSNKKNLSFQENQKELKNCSSVIQNSVTSTVKEFKENESSHNKSPNEPISFSKREKTTKAKMKKGFCASTPKPQTSKSQNNKCITNCGKILMKCENWDAPRVNSIQKVTVDLSRSEISEENDKTITVNSTLTPSEFNKKNTTAMTNDTFTIEDTIIAGDLTVISQRVNEMKRDSVCIVRSAKLEEPILLVVIEKLANFPKGTVDCSALTPLIRDQFPELLSSFQTPSKNSFLGPVPTTDKKVQDIFLTVPGSWIKLPGALGLKERLYAFADVQKNILVPICNTSQNWLLISLKSIELIHLQGKKMCGVKKNNEWCVLDFVNVFLKETVIPPDSHQSLKVSIKSKVPTKLELMLKFNLKELLNGEVQTRSLRIVLNNVQPDNYINVIPKDPINFGVIADQCFDERTVQISFDGICDLPLKIYIEEDHAVSGHFILKPHSGHRQDGEYSDNIFRHVFYEGEKQTLEFRVVFKPNVLLKEDSKTQDFKGELIIILGNNAETDGILRKIPVQGSVGFAKFLCDPSSNPLLFKASQKNQSISRSFPLKNVGALPITFSVWISNEDFKTTEDDIFMVPKSFYLSKNEEAAINVIFNAPATRNSTKRYMMLRIQPNGQIIYDVELIGITSFEGKSRSSNASVSTKLTTNSDSVPIKLLTTTHSLGWTATALEKEARQSFQIKSLSNVTISLRITFRVNVDVFKLVNENGERVHKMRKVLKPDCPCTLTVVFRPDLVGPHHNCLVFESNQSSNKKMIMLNGIGGIPNLFLGNVKSDLNGSKILRLQHSSASNQFENFLTFKNEGRISGFLLIKLGMKDFSLSHELNISPSSFVVNPNSTVKVKISQKLKNVELHQLLSGKEISKIATISVVTGDEPSRRRIMQLVESGKIQSSERLEMFIAPFNDEPSRHLKNFKDSSNFETEFLKNLKVYEIAIVIEKNAEILEPSILEETVDEFVSFMSANENTVISAGMSEKNKRAEANPDQPIPASSDPINITESIFPSGPLKLKSSKVTEWLETLDCF